MRSVTELPGGYAPLMKIDLQKDKKAALVVERGFRFGDGGALDRGVLYRSALRVLPKRRSAVFS